MKRIIVVLFTIIISVGCFAQIQHNEPDGFSWVEFEKARTGTMGSPEWLNAKGAKNSYGQIVVPAQYVTINYYSGYFVASQSVGDKKFYVGLYDRNGKEIVPVGDHYIPIISERDVEYGVLTIGDVGKQGAIDLSTGEVVIPLVYKGVALSDKGDLLAWDNSGNMHKFPWTKKNSPNQSNSDEVAELRRQVEELKKQVNGQQNSGGDVSSQSGGYNDVSNTGSNSYNNNSCSSCHGSGYVHENVTSQTMCQQCYGRGTCHTCGGNGWTTGMSISDRVRCSVCGQTGRCRNCNGSGKINKTDYNKSVKCRSCNGTGRK